MSMLRPGPRGRKESECLRDEADRYRRRAESDERWGNEELSPLSAREYLEQAARLDSAADAAEQKEGRR